MVSEGKPQSFCTWVDLLDVTVEVFHVKSQYLRWGFLGFGFFFFGKHLFQEGLHLNIDAFHAVESCLSNGAQRLAGGACCFPAQPQAGVFAVVSGCFFPLVSLLQGWM